MKEIPNFPGYFVTQNGEIFSNRKVSQGKRRGKYIPKHPGIYKLKKELFRKNRFRVNLIGSDGKPAHRFIAVLVLETFVCPRPSGYYACHGKLGSLEDSLENVYWATPKQNTADRKRDGTACIGEKNPLARLNEYQVRICKRLHHEYLLSHKTIASFFDVNTTTVHRAITGRTWEHLR